MASFTDTFTRADSTTIASTVAWDEADFANFNETAWKIVSNTLRLDADYWATAIAGSTGAANHWAQCTVTALSGTPAAAPFQCYGPIVRGNAGNTEGYFACAFTDRVRLYRGNNNANPVSITDFTVALTGTHTIRIEAEGTVVRVYTDGVLRGTQDISAHGNYTGQYVGVGGNGAVGGTAAVDNFDSSTLASLVNGQAAGTITHTGAASDGVATMFGDAAGTITHTGAASDGVATMFGDAAGTITHTGVAGRITHNLDPDPIEVEFRTRGYMLNATLAEERLAPRPVGRVGDLTAGRLGQGPVLVALGNRGGAGQVVPIRAGLDGYFERVKGSTSECSVTIPIGGTLWQRDRRIVELAREWRSEIIVEWAGRGLQWAGPVVGRLEGDNEVTLKAADLGAWASKRRTATHTHVGADQVTIANSYWADCFVGDTAQAWGVVTEPSGLLADRVSNARPEYVADALKDVGLSDWTWYKRTLLLGPIWGTEPRIRLGGASFMNPPPASGLGALGANRVVVYNPSAPGGLVTGTAENAGLIADDGLLVRLFEDKTVVSGAQANAKAAYHLGRLSRPVVIDIEGKSRLHPRAPVTIDELIPGKMVRIDVETAWQVLSEIFELHRVRVYFDGRVELELTSLALEDIGSHDARIARLEAKQRLGS